MPSHGEIVTQHLDVVVPELFLSYISIATESRRSRLSTRGPSAAAFCPETSVTSTRALGTAGDLSVLRFLVLSATSLRTPPKWAQKDRSQWSEMTFWATTTFWTSKQSANPSYCGTLQICVLRESISLAVFYYCVSLPCILSGRAGRPMSFQSQAQAHENKPYRG